MIPADELEAMQDTLEVSFPDTVTVTQRTASTGDSEGNEQFTTATVTYDGKLIHRTVQETGDPSEQQSGAWFVLLPHDAVIDSADTVTVGSQNFEVVGEPIYTPSPGQSTHIRVQLRIV